MKKVNNIFICLVHENQDCIIDLVRNLRYTDPDSAIILYNGGNDEHLFSHFPFERYGAIIHPSPRPLKWGWLHDFAIDCMEFALQHFEFELITVVDSDQLACGKQYGAYTAKVLQEHPDLGMLGQVASRIPENTTIDPAITAYEEKALWQPFLDTLPNGKDAYLYWTFWPSTAFTYRASAGLVNLFRNNAQLQEILKKTKIWASEEVILPTLTVALGFTIAENPCVYDYVKYRVKYSPDEIGTALKQGNSFWLHPVERRINDANRIAVRKYFANYLSSLIKEEVPDLLSAHRAANGHHPTEPTWMDAILKKVSGIEGWLSKDEAALLIASCQGKMQLLEKPVIAEIGSYCGKATAAIALTAQATNPASRIFAIDNFSGRLGAEDTRIDFYQPSFDKFNQTLSTLGITDQVEVIRETSHLADFHETIDVLLVDGLHDYASVARDFYAFEAHLAPDALIIFHDHVPDFPGVMAFVDELVANGSHAIAGSADSLVVLQNTSVPKANVQTERSSVTEETAAAPSSPLAGPSTEMLPLVTCIMPTSDRPEFIVHALKQFLQQDYANKELLIIDDGAVPVKYLVPQVDNIRYNYQDTKLDIGTKRNLACSMARGEIIVHFDDDDFYAPGWLTKQVSFLRSEGLDITGLSTPLFYNPETAQAWKYTYPEGEKPWVYGATMCYTRKFWQSNPFPAVSCGEDNQFVWSKADKKIRPHNETEAYIGRVHAKNTSPKHTHDPRWSFLTSEDAHRALARHEIA